MVHTPTTTQGEGEIHFDAAPVPFFARALASDDERGVTLDSAYQNQFRALRSRKRTSLGEPFIGAGDSERDRRRDGEWARVKDQVRDFPELRPGLREKALATGRGESRDSIRWLNVCSLAGGELQDRGRVDDAVTSVFPL